VTDPAVGIDGYRGGWVAAILDGPGVSWATAPVDAIAGLLPTSGLVGVDMPIGLLDEGWRACDALAKQELGSASARVFMTPPRPVLELGAGAPNDVVQDLCRRLTGQGVSRQALGLAERVLALDRALHRRSRVRVVEVHPELSFTELTGRTLPSKKSAAGVAARFAALRGWRPDTEQVVARAPADVPIDDALDALAALWSALRWREGLARTLPADALAPPFVAI